MKLTDIKNQKLKVLRDLIAFVWFKPNRLGGRLIIPDRYYNFDLRPGRFYLGEVIAIGPEVTEVKIKDKIIFQEYGLEGGLETIKENEIYFIREKNCLAVIKGLKLIPLDFRKSLTKSDIEELEKRGRLDT